VEIVAAVSNGKELLGALSKVEVKAVFLDVEMPSLSGLSAAAEIKRQYSNIFIVFVTAHTKYAAESYNFNAVDYLVKPITQQSITRAIKKIEKSLSQKICHDSHAEEQRIQVKNNHELYFINPSEIIFVEKELNKTLIHSINHKYFTAEPLHSVENKLGHNFFRCHKSFIINIQKIEKISPIADRLYEVTFYNYPDKVTMRRPKFEELCDIITEEY